MGERMVNSITPYPEIDNLLNQFLREIQAILGIRLIGLYLHGSLVCGDFNPQTSDIDFLVVTDKSLPEKTFFTLKSMHTSLFASKLAWSKKLEGAYIPRNDLRRHDPAHASVPWLGEDGHFALETLGSDWILQRWILRENGIAISGSPLKSMIDPVSPEDLRQAVRESLQDWWSPPFPSPKRFLSRAYQAYAILTMCRSLYMLEHGRLASKPAAADWAMHTLGEPWRALIFWAVTLTQAGKDDQLKGMVGLILFTLEKWGLPSGGKASQVLLNLYNKLY
jgi:predicted nucleotidyltransferase